MFDLLFDSYFMFVVSRQTFVYDILSHHDYYWQHQGIAVQHSEDDSSHLLFDFSQWGCFTAKTSGMMMGDARHNEWRMGFQLARNPLEEFALLDRILIAGFQFLTISSP